MTTAAAAGREGDGGRGDAAAAGRPAAGADPRAAAAERVAGPRRGRGVLGGNLCSRGRDEAWLQVLDRDRLRSLGLIVLVAATTRGRGGIGCAQFCDREAVAAPAGPPRRGGDCGRPLLQEAREASVIIVVAAAVAVAPCSWPR